MQCAHEAKTSKLISSMAPALSNVTVGPSSHTVATIMGYASNPVGYLMNNSSAILSDIEDEDKLDSSEVHDQLAH